MTALRYPVTASRCRQDLIALLDEKLITIHPADMKAIQFMIDAAIVILIAGGMLWGLSQIILGAVGL